MADLMPSGKQQYFTSLGAPLSGGKVFTYAAGTSSTPLVTYQDQAETIINSNPVILDSRGEASIFWGRSGYKVVLKDSTNVTIWTQDNLFVPSNNAADITYTPSGVGAVSTTVEAALQQWVSVKDFGATGDGVSDDTADVQLALNSGHANIYAPEGTYIQSASLNIPNGVTLFGAGKTKTRFEMSASAPDGTHNLTLQPFATVRDLWVRGNWDLTTAGLSGIGIYAKNTLVAMHGLTIDNVQIDRCRSDGLYVYEAAYLRIYNLISDTHGRDAVSFEGASAGSFTTTEIGGMSTFSSCPNGYGLRLNNCHSSKYTFVSEYTLGVAFQGNHRSLLFDSCYFETPASALQPHIFNTLSGGAFGITIQNNFLGMTVQTSVFQGDVNYQYGVMVNNSNLSTVPYLNANYKNWTIVDAGVIKRALGVNCLLNSQAVAVGNVGAGEDILFTYTLPGGTLSATGEGVRIRAWGKTAANANNKTLKMHFGSTVFYNSGALAVNDKDWVLNAVVLRGGAVDQSLCVDGSYNNAAVVGATTSAQTMANDIIIKVTGEATANNDLLCLGAIVERLNIQSATF